MGLEFVTSNKLLDTFMTLDKFEGTGDQIYILWKSPLSSCCQQATRWALFDHRKKDGRCRIAVRPSDERTAPRNRSKRSDVICMSSSEQSTMKQSSKEQGTATALLTRGILRCFCSQSHQSEKCRTVEEVEEHKQALRRSNS